MPRPIRSITFNDILTSEDTDPNNDNLNPLIDVDFLFS